MAIFNVRIHMQELFMIGGPNGAGKTTSAMKLLPGLLNCEEYVNADAIAAALSPFHPETTAIQAGRLMLDRIHSLAAEKKVFSFETTMASLSFAPFLKKCKEQGYKINVLYLWLQNPELAIDRVALRVQNGGHNVPEQDIRRRYYRGLSNFFKIYVPLADKWLLCNNSGENTVHIASGDEKSPLTVHHSQDWLKIQEHQNELRE